jgi:hypothetical protein
VGYESRDDRLADEATLLSAETPGGDRLADGAGVGGSATSRNGRRDRGN